MAEAPNLAEMKKIPIFADMTENEIFRILHLPKIPRIQRQRDGAKARQLGLVGGLAAGVGGEFLGGGEGTSAQAGD